MKIIVLTDNIGTEQLKGEWGLSLLVEYDGSRFLLDTGQSDLFIQNARTMGLDLAGVDNVVISHAHYDHSRGLEAFFAVNGKAGVWISPNAADNCYAGTRFFGRYIGLPKGVTALYETRIKRPSGIGQIAPGVFLVPHSTLGLERLGKRNHLFVRRGLMWFEPDDFAHEQTLVFRTQRGLVLMNSCSHSGPDVIVSEVQRAFPSEHIYAYLGGLHLFRLTDTEVQAVADRLEDCGIELIYTGHCTGDRAFALLKSRFGDRIGQFHCGLEVEL